MHWHNRYQSAHSFIRIGLLVVLSAALALSFGRVPAAYAAYLTVTNVNDSGPGSLRQVIADASSGDTIVLIPDLREQTITLTSGSLDISKNLTILGPGTSRVTISGNDMMRVLHVGLVTVRLENLAIAHGYSGFATNGGGIANDGRLTIVNSSFLDNHSTVGGAIYNSTYASLTVSNSTFLSNFAGSPYVLPFGSSIANYGQLVVANSTFSGDLAVAFGEISRHSGAIYNTNTLALTNSTFFGDATSALQNAGVAVVKNTIFAALSCDGSLSPGSTHNISTDSSCGPSAVVVNMDALNPGPLQYNGGATQTFGLLPGSVAIDAGDNATCAAAPVNNHDQRGMVRPQGHACDIGAFEADHPNLPPTAHNDRYNTTANSPLTVTAPGVLANDTDPENNALQALSSSGPSHGTLSLNTNGSFTYTPKKDFIGTDTFTYKASDGGDVASGATVSITVALVGANDDSYTVEPDTALKVFAPGVLENDKDVYGKPIMAHLVGEPTYGTLTLDEDGSFIYTPKDGFIGVDQFTYLATDGYDSSNIATASITVQ